MFFNAQTLVENVCHNYKQLIVPRNLRISTYFNQNHFLMRGMVKAVVDTLSIAQAGKSPESSGNALQPLHCVADDDLEKIVGSWR